MPTGEIGSGGGAVYPGALDVNATPEVNSPNAGKTKARKEVVEDLSAIVIAIETALGTDPRGTATSVKAFLQKGHNPSGTHKPWIDAADYASLNLAVAAASGSTVLIYSTTTLTANLTIPDNVNIEIWYPGLISMGAYTLTTGSGSFIASHKQIFSGTGLVTLGSGSVRDVNVRWFGALGDGSTNDTVAIQAAINCASQKTLNVYVPSGHYKYTNLYLAYDATLNPNYNSSNSRQGRFRFFGDGEMNNSEATAGGILGTVLESTDTVGPALLAEKNASPWPLRRLRIEKMSLLASNSTYVVSMKGNFNHELRDILIYQKSATGNGILNLNYDQSIWESVFVIGNLTTFVTGIGITMDNVTAAIDSGQSIFSRVTARGFTTAWQLGDTNSSGGNQSQNHTYIGCFGITSNVGLILGDYFQLATFIGCVFKGKQYGGYSVGQNRNVHFMECTFKTDNTSAGSPAGLGCFWVGNGTTDAGRQSDKMTFTNCYFNNISSQVFGLKITFSSLVNNVRAQNCHFYGGDDGTGGIGIWCDETYQAAWNFHQSGNAFGTTLTPIFQKTSYTVASANTIAPISLKDNEITGNADIYAITPPDGTLIGETILLRFSGNATPLHGPVTTYTITSLTFSGTTATATTSAAHGRSAGDGVVVVGASPAEYNGYHVILTAPTTTTFTYKVPALPTTTTPATGTITAQRGNLRFMGGNDYLGTYAGVGDRPLEMTWTKEGFWQEVSKDLSTSWYRVSAETISSINHYLALSAGSVFSLTHTLNTTINAPALRTGARIVVQIIQDGTGGRTTTWSATFKVTWSETGNTANKRSQIAFICDGTNWVQDGAQVAYA